MKAEGEFLRAKVHKFRIHDTSTQGATSFTIARPGLVSSAIFFFFGQALAGRVGFRLRFKKKIRYHKSYQERRGKREVFVTPLLVLDRSSLSDP